MRCRTFPRAVTTRTLPIGSYKQSAVVLNGSMANTTLIPNSPVDGKPIYRAGSSVADVFLACSAPNGATVAQLKRLFNTDVAMYPITRHADTRGRRGMRWTLTVNGKPATVNIGSMSDTDRVRITNVRKSDSFVNSKHDRAHAASTSALLASAKRDTATATKPAIASAKPAPAKRTTRVTKPATVTVTPALTVTELATSDADNARARLALESA